MQTVPRLAEISREDLEREYVRPGRPVIIEGIGRDWPAAGWDAAEYGRRGGSSEVHLEFSSSRSFDYAQHTKVETLPFGDAMQRVIALLEGRGEHCYLQSFPLHIVPQIEEGFRLPPYLDAASIEATNLWIGAGGTVPLHFDILFGLHDNIMVQVVGRKKWTIVPPTCPMGDCYPKALGAFDYNTSQVDVEQFDATRFPRFPIDQALEGILNPGDMIFVPHHWWHQVSHDGFSVSVNYTWKALPRPFAERARMYLRPGSRRMMLKRLRHLAP